jgi:CMP-N-acetylneuraminic acid synthetase
VVSVCRVKHHPYWLKTISADGWLSSFVEAADLTSPRQALPDVFALNGAIYLARTQTFLTHGWHGPKTAAYVMPFERSVDIDTPVDFALAELVIAKGKRQNFEQNH